MSNKQDTRRQLAGRILIVIALIICLLMTTFALVRVAVSVEDNYFQTGSIEINLNDGKPVIEEHEFLFEPGMRVNKEFFIENLGTWDCYYKIYMDQVSGGLADVLDITISDGNQVLFAGTAAELSRANVQVADDTLGPKEKKNLLISFHYPENSGNETQSHTLTFRLCAEGVQTKNNPDKAFE